MSSIFKKTGLTLALIGATSLASAVEFDDFSSKVSHLKLNVDAAKVGENLRLTPNFWWKKGSAFTLKTLNVAKFSTFFTFQITGPFSLYGPGDGFTFAMQALSPSEIGDIGPALGYGGQIESGQLVGGIRNSIAVEVDTYDNVSFGDPNANHIAIDINGDTRHTDSSLVKEIAPSLLMVKNGMPGLTTMAKHFKYA
jgi:Legume lectin domain